MSVPHEMTLKVHMPRNPSFKNGEKNSVLSPHSFTYRTEAFCEAELEQRRAVVCMWVYATCLAI